MVVHLVEVLQEGASASVIAQGLGSMETLELTHVAGLANDIAVHVQTSALVCSSAALLSLEWWLTLISIVGY